MVDFSLIEGIGLVVALFLITFLFKNLRIRFFDSHSLMTAALNVLLFGIFFLVAFYLRSQGNGAFSIFENLALIPLNIVWISGYLYYEGFLYVKPPMWRYTLMLIMGITNILLVSINIGGALNLPQPNTLVTMMTFYLGSIFHSFAIYVTFQIIRIYPKRAVKIDNTSLFLVGIAASIAGTKELLEYLGVTSLVSLTSFPTDSIYIIAGIFLIAGISVLLINNLKWGNYIYYIPVPVHIIMVYNDGGLLVYNRNVAPVQGENTLEDKEYLIPSALSAFSTFFQEILGSNANLTHVSAKLYEFYFSELPDHKGTIVVIASGANFFLKRSINLLKKSISQGNLERLSETTKTDEFDSEFDEYVTKSFPYLVIKKKSTQSQDNLSSQN